MKTIRLEIDRTPAPLRAVAGWLLQGGDPAAWLAEIARWRVGECRLHVLPRSREDASPGAALVLTHARPATTPAAAPYGTLAGKLFLPVDATLLPALTDAEITELCGDGVLVFHPGLGAVVCKKTLALADLVRGPQELDEPLAHAVDFRPPHRRVEAVGFRSPPDLEDLMQELRGDIGTEPKTDLPPAKDEPKEDLLSRGKRGVRRAGWGLAKWLIGGAGAAGAGMLGKMGQWVNDRFNAVSSEIEKLRQKSINRLLDQLQNDPDEALKHAIPLAGHGQHRGTAPPSGHLDTRNPNFSLNRLGGGGASDPWHLDWKRQEELRRHYLRLAERERRLGRWGRAAYIYAELLGDLASSAATLKEGKMWREAALLYRDHLRLPLAAAECFVEARMPQEAIAIYEKHGEYERLARLYRQIGDEPRALQTFNDWIQKLLLGSRCLDAANVMLNDIGDRERGIKMLEGFWPDAPEVAACLDRLFALRAEAGEHDQARAFIQRMGAPTLAGRHLTTSVAAFSRLQGKYPDRGVRAFAEDMGRQQIARVLGGEDETRSRELARMLPSLAPDDRLLGRDVQRFVSASKATPKPVLTRRVTPTPVAVGEIEISRGRETRLGKDVHAWTHATSASRMLYAVGKKTDALVAAALDADWVETRCEWTIADPFPPLIHLVLCAPAEGFPNALLLHFSLPLKMQPLGPGRIGSPVWITDFVYAASISRGALWLLRQTPSGLALSGHQRDGTLLNQQPISPIIREQEPEWQENTAGVLPGLAAFGEELAVSVADHLLVFPSASPDQPVTTSFDGPILALVPGPRWAKPHVAVIFSDRVEICWVEGRSLSVHLAIGMLENPCAGFTSEGTLVIVSGKTGFLVESDSRGRQRRARFAWSAQKPVAVLPGRAARTFVVVEETGQVTEWQFGIDALR